MLLVLLVLLVNIDGRHPRISTTPSPDIDAAILHDISANGAMTKLTISGDESYSMPVTMEASMTEADFSGKYLMASGAIMLAAFLPKCQ